MSGIRTEYVVNGRVAAIYAAQMAKFTMELLQYIVEQMNTKK